MIRPQGILFRHAAPHFDKKKVVEDLEGNSGVGQALEFPSESLTSSDASSQPVFLRRLLSWSGTFLMLVAIGGFVFSYGSLVITETRYRLRQWFPKETASGRFADVLGTTSGDILYAPDPNFSLVIPKIDARGKIIQDVDPADYSAYMEALTVGIAHAKGTKLPGETGNIFLFAHSTENPLNVARYNAVFYLLRELTLDDEVIVYYSGVKHRYAVHDTKIVAPTDVTYLTPENSEGVEQIILQTCFPPGTNAKRLLVFARKSPILDEFMVEGAADK